MKTSEAGSSTSVPISGRDGERPRAGLRPCRRARRRRRTRSARNGAQARKSAIADAAAAPEVELVEHGDRQPERQRAPEVVAVEADRLRDQLADRALAGRQRRRQLRHRAPRAAGARRRAAARGRRRSASSARSGSAISLTTARTSSAGTPASSQARSTAKPSIASTSQPLEPPTRAEVPIGQTRASGNDGARGREQRARPGSALEGTSDGIFASQ